MLQLPTGYLTVDKSLRRPVRVQGPEVETGRFDLVDRLWDYALGDKADRLQAGLLLRVVLPAILLLIVRNIVW